MRRPWNWRQALTHLRFVVSGGLLAYLIWRADPAAIWAEWRSVNVWLIGVAFLMQLLGVAVSAAKWSVLLRARQQDQPYLRLLGIYFAGQFANNFLPTSVGGDALRVVLLGRHINSYSQSSASVFLDRLTGFMALSLIAGTALVITASDLFGIRLDTAPAVTLLTAGFIGAAVCAGIVSFNAPHLLKLLGTHRLPEVTRKPLQTIATALADYTPQGRQLAQVLGMSLLFHGVWIGSHIVCGIALGIQAPLLIYALMVPITDIVGLAPIFVNNLGAREAMFTLYLAQVGVTNATALALAFMIFTVRLCVSAVGGLVVLFGGASLRIPRPASDAVSGKS